MKCRVPTNPSTANNERRKTSRDATMQTEDIHKNQLNIIPVAKTVLTLPKLKGFFKPQQRENDYSSFLVENQSASIFPTRIYNRFAFTTADTVTKNSDRAFGHIMGRYQAQSEKQL